MIPPNFNLPDGCTIEEIDPMPEREEFNPYDAFDGEPAEKIED